MGRKQRSTLTLSVKIPVPPGYTQKRVIEEATTAVKTAFPYAQHEVIVRLEKKDIAYY